MSSNPIGGSTSPEALARQAEDLAGKLKAGTWESAQTLALISIAKSLVVIAAQTASPSGSGTPS